MRKYFDYQWNPVLFLFWSYSLWVRKFAKEYRKDIKRIVGKVKP